MLRASCLLPLCVVGLLGIARLSHGQELPTDLAPPDVAIPSAQPTPAKSTTTASPAADPKLWLLALPKRDVAVAHFQNVTPGTTRLPDVLKAWGSPRERITGDGTEKLVYQIGPFPRVEVTASDDVVTLIDAKLETPREVGGLVKELELERFALAFDAVAAGEPRRFVVPDRGMRLVLTDAMPPTVSHIQMALPTADDFVLRARSDDSLFFRQQLADLEQALKLQPGHAEALVGIARIWDRVGYAREARRRLLESATDAKPAEAANDGSASATAKLAPIVRLEIARLSYRLGELEEASQLLQQVLPELPATGSAKCRAELIMAELLARRRPPVEAKSVWDQFFLAIQSAQQCLTEGDLRTALEAHEVLLEAHLGAARYIARSTSRNKSETVAKWLANAETMLRREEEAQSMPLARWSQWLAVLECQVALGGSAESKAAAAQLAQTGDLLLGQVTDDLAVRYLRGSYGYGLGLAARSLLMAGDAQGSTELAERAIDLLSATAQQLPPHPASEACLGQTLFLRGSLEAVGRKDHRAAMRWYDRALPLLETHGRTLPDLEPQEIAEQFVSIGLSSWETGSRGEGLKWTERGLIIIQDAMGQGRCPPSAQSAPCYNLAFMYDALGQKEKSQQMAELARRSEAAQDSPR